VKLMADGINRAAMTADGRDFLLMFPFVPVGI
jgi:hypothetical protein